MFRITEIRLLQIPAFPGVEIDMIRLWNLSCILLMLIACGQAGTAQTKDVERQTQMGLEYNRLMRRLKIIDQHAKMAKSKLELTKDQQDELKELRRKHQEVVKSSLEIENVDEKLAFLLSQLDSLDKRVSRDILLPHQVRLLDQEVYSHYMRLYQGNLAAAIVGGYGGFIGLTKNQSEKVAELSSTLKKEIGEAKKEFEEKIRMISEKGNKKLSEILTPDQMKTLKNLRQSN